MHYMEENDLSDNFFPSELLKTRRKYNDIISVERKKKGRQKKNKTKHYKSSLLKLGTSRIKANNFQIKETKIVLLQFFT